MKIGDVRMYILSKDQNSIINLEQVTVVYIGSDSCTIKADYQNGKGCQLGRYNSEEEAKIAMNIISENVGKTEICKMPTNEAVKAKCNLKEQKNHHIGGKKTKGHGGS